MDIPRRPLKRFEDGVIFETKNTMCVLVGSGHEKRHASKRSSLFLISSCVGSGLNRDMKCLERRILIWQGNQECSEKG